MNGSHASVVPSPSGGDHDESATATAAGSRKRVTLTEAAGSTMAAPPNKKARIGDAPGQEEDAVAADDDDDDENEAADPKLEVCCAVHPRRPLDLLCGAQCTDSSAWEPDAH